ncbi:Solute carrier family 10 member 6 [Chionoecetes opilio]|uniref:Solute carrier family 10 member 6 n=1 Tax=Chionoecetes opilio TaxID=41210 RepID=A0A8J4YRQ6_CHIOP|nr:Solute carrier family 10 member 6 [Chionoecetes opilio]
MPAVDALPSALSSSAVPWPEGWPTSWVAGRLEVLHEAPHNSSGEERPTPHELPQWLVRLDQAAALLMTLNTVTLMLGVGAATYWKEFWDHLKRPWACLVGVACQFVLLPAVGFSLCLAFHLPPYQALGVLILVCSPGGAFSNFFTFWVDGDLALSIIMTAVSSVLALGMMPLNVWLWSWRWTDQEVQVPYLNILISLVIVTAPVFVGMMVRHYSSRLASYVAKVCGVVGWAGAITCGLLLILRYWDIIVKSSIDLVIIAVLTPLTGFSVAYILVKILCFSHKICRTVAIETGCQNMVVAISIILLSLRSPR